MVIRERLAGGVANVHRVAMRRIPLQAIEDAYRDLMLGRSEWYLCVNIGVSPGAFEGVLQFALEEAPWERGHLGPQAAAGGKNWL